MRGNIDILSPALQANHPDETIFKLKCKFATISKPIPQSTLDFFRNLKVNRFVVPEETSLEDSLRIYYNEYKQLYEQNKHLNRQFIQIIQQKNELQKVLVSIKKVNQARGGQVKRRRRYASQIKREFNCPAHECGKCYGTEGSLTQHVKLKHMLYFQSGEYEIYLGQILKEKESFQTQSN